MAVSVQDPHDTQAALRNQVITDLNTGDYGAAWQAALQSSKSTGTTYNAAASTSNPLLASLETAQGLQALDPSKKWAPADTQAYYQAMAGTGIFNGVQGESLGQNAYGKWGSGSAVANGTDAAANLKVGTTPDVMRFAGAQQPKSFLSKYGADIAMIAAAVIAPEAIPALAGAMGGGLAASVAAGGIFGAGSTAASDLLSGQPITGKGLLGGAVGGAIGYGGAAGALGGGAVGGAAAGALGGAAKGAINGTGALQGAELGAVGGGISGAIGGSGLNNVIGNTGSSIVGNQLANVATSAVGSNMMGQGTLGGTSNGILQQTQGANGFNLSSLLGGGAGLLGAGLGFASNQQQSNMQNNAYTTAGNAGNTNPWNVNGLGGIGANFSNGQINLNGGAVGSAANAFGQFANNQLGYANSLNGGVPSSVAQAGGNYTNALNTAGGYNSLAQGSAAGVMGQGINQLNNPLIGQAFGNASNLLNSAGASYGNAYNTSLQSQLAALNPAIQQQSNALLNSNFERGQAGTSGGALNAQALQNSFNQADLQAQGNAVSQANALLGTTYNAANTASGIGTSGLAAGGNLFNTGAGNLANANSLGANLGLQGLTGQENIASFAPQLAGMYNSNATSATAGFGNLNNSTIANANLGLAVGTNQGNQLNRAAATQGQIANTWNGGNTGAGSTLANSFGSLLSGSNPNTPYAGLLGSIFGLFGGSPSSSGAFGTNTGSSAQLSNTDLNNIYSGSFTASPEVTPAYASYGGGGT